MLKETDNNNLPCNPKLLITKSVTVFNPERLLTNANLVGATLLTGTDATTALRFPGTKCDHRQGAFGYNRPECRQLMINGALLLDGWCVLFKLIRRLPTQQSVRALIGGQL